LTPGALRKKHVFLDVLAVFRLDYGQISFNLVENASATRQHAVLATSIAFYDILARACAEIKIVTYVLRLFEFGILFLAFPFSLSLFFLL